MIPADVASRLQLAADIALRPVAPGQEIADKLSDLAPGQRVMAEIQALLPNGTYRAVINQRDVILALPFAAKAGDSLELEVVNSDGKLTLAVISKPPDESVKLPAESVPTTLSRTGQLISNLFGNTGEGRSGPIPTALNGNQPIVSAPPTTAQDLLPLLKQAITQSGMFYESHQAEWVDGRMEKSALLQEPQGKLAAYATPIGYRPAHGDAQDPPGKLAAHAVLTANQSGEQLAASRTDSAHSQNTMTDPGASKATAGAAQPSQLVAVEALPLVRQQLDALATQSFSWQGQVWPGQEMRWEIEEDASRREQVSDEGISNWQTRLRLTLPRLGEVDAQIRLQGNQISLSLTTGNTDTRELLHTATNMLRSQLDAAGLILGTVGVGDSNNGDTGDQTTG